VFRRVVPMIGLVAACGFVLAAAPARAQVNIDQGKSTAEIFNGDCGTCHKSAKGLANGKNAATLAGFLREHYTSSAQQAASLAAFVLGAGAGPAPNANLKPGTANPKAGEAKPGEAKSDDTKPGDKSAARPGRPDAGATAKTEAAPSPEPAAPGRKPAAGKRDQRPVTASRGPRQEPESPPPAPQPAPMPAAATPEAAPVPVATEPPAEPAAPLPATAAAPSAVTEPAPSAAAPTAESTSSTNAAAPAEAPSDSAPVPRDDIPD
jgi:hypothetical protein